MRKVTSFLERIDFSSVWIFLTDKCNLNCDYCFFKYRSNNHTISYQKIKALFDSFPEDKYLNIVISGGEPGYEWEKVEFIFRYVKENFSEYDFMIETNCLFLDASKVKMLKEYNVVVEMGIDGDYLTMSKHRKLTKNEFCKLLEGIELILNSEIRVSPTMTVHPAEADKMFDNFLFLESLGLYSIDVHPALFGDWNDNASLYFIKGYRRIAAYDRKKGGRLLNKSYSVPINLSIDLVILPTGEIFPNWIYLCLAPEKRKKYSIGHVTDTKIILYRDNILSLLKKYKDFFKKERSYGEVSNFNLLIARKDYQNTKAEKTLYNYLNIWKIMKRTDLLNIKLFNRQCM